MDRVKREISTSPWVWARELPRRVLTHTARIIDGGAVSDDRESARGSAIFRMCTQMVDILNTMMKGQQQTQHTSHASRYTLPTSLTPAH